VVVEVAHVFHEHGWNNHWQGSKRERAGRWFFEGPFFCFYFYKQIRLRNGRNINCESGSFEREHNPDWIGGFLLIRRVHGNKCSRWRNFIADIIWDEF
jgi:hypothetical protein